MENKGQIHELIGKAIGMIGAIGKDQMNVQQKFRYRGIDQVYNALNPVIAELGIFICPEVLDMKREERTTKNGTCKILCIDEKKFGNKNETIKEIILYPWNEEKFIYKNNKKQWIAPAIGFGLIGLNILLNLFLYG